MNIALDEKFSIQSDKKNYILVEKFKNRDIHFGYYSSLSHLFSDYFNLKIRLSKSKSLTELLKYVENLSNTLKQAQTMFKIEVIVKK